jgi:hypothetical protein
VGGLLLVGLGRAGAEDWPTWRYDAGRTAASPEELPGELHLQWVRHLPVPRPAWTKYPRLCFDVSYEPVVMGKAMFVPSMVTDSLTALDTETGEQRWKFHADGPVRFAPLAFDGKVCFVSDDGFLYCLDAGDGRLLWKVRGLPEERQDRKVLGNDRLISLWPVRGGPVRDDKHVYFAAGVWPFEGVYVCAVDAATGELVWRNAECSDIELGLTDHSMRQDTGISPQGYLALIGGKLLVPSGRALPGVLDCQTGKLEPYVTGWGGRDNLAKGCWYVVGNETYSFQSGDVYESKTRQRIQIDPANAKELGEFRDVVLTDAAAYFSQPVNEGRGYRPAGVGYREIAAWDLTQPPKMEQWEDAVEGPHQGRRAAVRRRRGDAGGVGPWAAGRSPAGVVDDPDRGHAASDVGGRRQAVRGDQTGRHSGLWSGAGERPRARRGHRQSGRGRQVDSPGRQADRGDRREAGVLPGVGRRQRQTGRGDRPAVADARDRH